MIYIILILLGIPIAIWGIFIEKRKVGKFLGILGLFSIFGFGWMSYIAANQIISASVQLNFVTKYEENKFQNSSMHSVQQGSMAYVAFIRKQTPILVVPSRYIIQDSTSPNEVKISGQFDLLADSQVSQVNGNIQDIKKSDWVQFKIPDIFSSEKEFIESGIIELVLNGGKKMTFQIPTQSIASDTIVMSIKFP